MTLIVAGTVRIPPERVETFRPQMRAMLDASRAEPGCVTYSYAEDVLEKGLIRVFEAWRDREALDAHFATPHMAEWRVAWPEFGVSDRRLTLYDVSGERAL